MTTQAPAQTLRPTLNQTPPRTRQAAIAAAMDQSRLVSPPAVALQVVSAASKHDCRPSEISALLSQDPALCAKLLKTVNSCVFGLAKPVASLDRAVMVIGLTPLRSLVLGLSLPVLQTVPKPDPALKEYWLSSVAGAILARELSVLRKLPSPDSDMVAGLLRDIGAMLIQRTFPHDYANVAGSTQHDLLEHQCEIEEQMIGINHADLSAELLRRWNLPEDVVEPIRYHHDPDHLKTARKPLGERAELLYLADMLTQIDSVVEEPDALRRMLKLAETRFGLNQKGLVDFLERIAPKLAEFANLLKLDMGVCPDYAGVLSEGCDALVKLTVESNSHTIMNPPRQVPSPHETIDHSMFKSPSNSMHSTGGSLYNGAATAIGMPPMAEPHDDLPDFTPIFLSKLPPGGCKLGGYEVESKLGSGSMGVVFKALDPGLGRPVAIKMLTPDLAAWPVARERFAREARTAAAIRHENVVAIYAVREAAGMPYLAMEYVEGASLEDLLEKMGPLPLTDVIRYGRQIASGLSAAHTRKIIHRDIKPANIMLDESSQSIKLTDFGLARAESDVKLTTDGMLVGSPLYMSPEQVRGDTADARSDLFAFGAVLFQLTTGGPPFPGHNMASVFRAITENEPKSPRDLRPEVPVWLDQLILRLLRKKPEERYQTADEVVIAIDSATLVGSGSVTMEWTKRS